jgi:gliding motility-associated-like protein
MLNKLLLSCTGLSFLQTLLWAELCIAQSGRTFAVGESGLFNIKAEPETYYQWSVTEHLDKRGGDDMDKVIFLGTRDEPEVRLRWDKAGLYFLTVMAFNLQGCSNRKIFPVVVLGNHSPQAYDDYLSINWLNSIRLNLLDNDYDAGMDLDTNSLKILSQPSIGEILKLQNGSMVYRPIRNTAGKDRFYYKVCDTCNQCDTAMVTITLKDPPLFLPEGISPNGDGINDLFVISGLQAYPNSTLTIFSRDGIIIFHSKDYRNDWNGLKSGLHQQIVPSGTYYYLLQPGGSSRVIKGFVHLIK